MLSKRIPRPRQSIGTTLLLAACLLLQPAPAFAANELVVLTWADYIDPGVVEEFEEQHDAKVRFVYFRSDAERNRILVASDARGFDLAVVDGLDVGVYVTNGWLSPAPREQIPNLRHIERRWTTAFPAAERYGIPYFWGTLGIAYRKDRLPQGIKSWREFFSPREALRGRITMSRNSRDALGMALKSLGHSANASERSALRAASRVLEGQRPYVRAYADYVLTEQSPLVTGEAWASMMYNGEAALAQRHNPNIAFTVPSEGGNLWVDYLAVLRASQRKPLAAKFIDFLHAPKIAARNAEFVHYATPNVRARALLPAEYAQDPVIYPSAASLSRSEIYQEHEPRTRRAMNTLFAQLLD